MPALTLVESTSLTSLWRIIASDGTAHNVTSGTREIVYAGVTYTVAAVTPTEQQLIENLDPSNLELILPLDAGGVTERDLREGKWNQARVEIRVYDYAAGTVVRAWTGVLFTVETNNGQLKAEVLDLAVLFTQPLGDIYSEQCRADHGDAACGNTPETFALTVTASPARDEFVVTHTQAAADYFEYGKVTWTSGANNTLQKEIKSATQEGASLRVKLVESMRGVIGIGDTVTLAEGCQKTIAACAAKGNAARFRGEPGIPGLYKLTRRWPE